jgi:hypothetical protein
MEGEDWESDMRIVSGMGQKSLTTPAHLLRRRDCYKSVRRESGETARLLLLAAQPQGEGKKK